MSDRELDAKVAELMGLHVPEQYWRWKIPHYSTDIAAAWLVVDKMRESNDEIKFKFQGYFVLHQIEHLIDITPDAICRAAVMAAEAE